MADSTTYTTKDGLPADFIRELAKDGSNNIWIRTSRRVTRYSHGVFTTFAMKDGLVDDLVTAICADPKHGVFAATSRAVYQFVNGKFVLVEGLVSESDGRTDRLACAPDGSLWVGFENTVVKKWKAGVVTVYNGERNLSPRFASIYQGADGTVWAGSRDGLYQLVGEKFKRIAGDARTGIGAVSSLCLDREGSLWIGQEAGRLARLRKTKLTTISEEDGLQSDSTRSVFQDSRGNVWIGTVGGLSRLSNGTITNYSRLEGRPIPFVTSIGEDKDGNLWIGVYGTLFVMKDGQFVRQPRWQRMTDIKVIYGDRMEGCGLEPMGTGYLNLKARR